MRNIKIKSTLIACLVMLLAASFMPATVAGFNVNGYKFANGWTSYCLASDGFSHGGYNTDPWPEGLTGTRANTVRAGLGMWNDRSGTSFRYSYAGQCDFDIFGNLQNAEVGVAYSHLGTLGPIARGGPYKTSGSTITEAWVHFNADTDSKVWWGQQVQVPTGECKVGAPPGCKPDILTIAAHEAGHAIGFAHPNSGHQCVAGWLFRQDEQACPDAGSGGVPYAERVMYENAGDGYRREFTQDEISGLQYLYP